MKVIVLVVLLGLSAPAWAETVVYTGLATDTDYTDAHCALSRNVTDYHWTARLGVRHDLIEQGRATIALRAEHVSCLMGTDDDSSNTLGLQIEWRLFH